LKKIKYIFIFLFFSIQLFSQNDIEKLISDGDNYIKSGNKNLAANSYYQAATKYWFEDDAGNAILYFENALTIYQEIKNDNAIKIINSNLGQINTDLGNFELAVNYFTESLSKAEKLNDKADIASQLLNIASVQSLLENYGESNVNLMKALNLAQQENNTKLIRSCYGTLAENYEKLGETQKSIEYYNFFLTFEKLLKEQEISAIQEKSKIDIEKAESEKREKELELILNSYKLSEVEDSLKVIEIENQLSELEVEKLEKEKLEQDFLIKEQKSQQLREATIRQAITIVFGIVLIFAIIMFFQIKQKSKANKLLVLQKIEIEKQSKKLGEQNHELEKLSIVASKTDNAVIIIDNDGVIEWANEAFNRMWGYSLPEYKTNFGENVLNDPNFPLLSNSLKKCIEVKKSVDYVSKFMNKFGNEIWTHTTLTPILEFNDIVSKVVAIDSDITEIKVAEEKLKDSILYASRIQLAILPDLHVIKYLLPESFVFFKPRDVVSGDFYWINETSDFIAIAAADCTGHGVPGALMSILGMSFLNEIIKNNDVKNPADTLNLLRNKIKSTLKQDQGNEQRREGMDIALCFISKTEKKLDFAGAYNPLYILRNNEVEIIKADKMPIGNYIKEESFTNFSVEIQDNDFFYIFTDGFIDQFGGEKNEKFKGVRFKKLISEMQNIPLPSQPEKFSNSLSNWQGNKSQMDDILVIGFKV